MVTTGAIWRPCKSNRCVQCLQEELVTDESTLGRILVQEVQNVKAWSYLISMALVTTVLFSSVAIGFSSSARVQSSFSWAGNNGLVVWFDYPYFLGEGPCQYQLVIHAKSSNGFWITNLHWNFGDGSALDVRVTWESLVTDSQVHGYVSAGTYVVSVTATDTGGNSYTAYWGLFDAFPTSCIREPGTTSSSVTTIIWNSALFKSITSLDSLRRLNKVPLAPIVALILL